MSLETIKNLKKKMADVRAEMQRVGRDALQQAFDDFLSEYPEVLGISWAQYTPYFNDGDVCRFSVHDFDVELRDKTSNEDDVYEKLSEFEHKISNRDLFLAAFGDHKSITATADGFKVEKCDHD